jgi:drug/metabolite transporter (DMT)-like permease
MRQNARAAWGMAATAVLWSTGGLAIKLVPLSPMAVAGWRSLLSAATLLLLFRASLDFRPTPARLGAAVAYAGLLVTNVAATKLTTAANAILLAYTAPVYVALLAPVFLGEKTRRADWLFVAASLGGMALFFVDKLSATGFWGNILAVGTGLSYAAFTLCMRAGREDSPVSAVIAGHVLTVLAALPFLADGLPGSLGAGLGLVYLGVVQQGLSLALYVWCIARLPALSAMLLLTIEPIVNPVLVALGYGELPGLWACLGGVVVVAAVTLRGGFGRTRPETPAG